ncbi:hypothetical protein TI03_05690, partial [Achromatium sp. WMS1]
GKVLQEHPRIVIATDDIYEHIRWRKDPFVNILSVCPDLYHSTRLLRCVFWSMPSGCNQKTMRELKSIIYQADSYVQTLNNRFAKPSGNDNPANSVSKSEIKS